MGRKKRHDAAAAAARADDSVPFGFLLGEQYSGYSQALSSSKDLKVKKRDATYYYCVSNKILPGIVNNSGRPRLFRPTVVRILARCVARGPRSFQAGPHASIIQVAALYCYAPLS